MVLRALVLLFVVLGSGVLAAERQARALKQGRPNAKLQAEFEKIYESKLWGTDGAGSGAGSSLSASSYARSILRLVVNKFGIRGMIDAPCGAMAWMPSVLRDIWDDIEGFQYLGVDIVQSVIMANIEHFKHQTSWMHFRTMDFSEQPLPGGYDLIFCRDALQHLPLLSGINALENFSKTKARYLLVGSYATPKGNREIDINAGGNAYFDINLTEEPFFLTGYQQIFSEHTDILPSELEKHMLLYPMHYLKAANFTEMRIRARAMNATTVQF